MKIPKFQDIILFENDDYIILNKPSGFPVLEDRNLPPSHNLLSLIRQERPDAQVAHRLDKETSGALVVAKHAEAYRNSSIQFEKRQVEKEYHAVVEGLQEYENRKIDIPLRTTNKGIAVKDYQGGKRSETIVSSLAAYRRHTLVKCHPITGRMHQIRVHLALIGAPIAGDEMYGGQWVYLSELKRRFNLKQGEEERPLMQRVALHAYAIKMKGLAGDEISAQAPYPKDFAVLLKQLEKNK
ncbi:MAG: RNA pseudouridine synthase [Cyclobacteriaceae bacterium]|nr:RNA pseudouridine synthase [Cyclobacteriaceae bacterium]MCH8515972.1 RNA pseudouridine synthase [Cyclobacteriaceae bacterium]